MNADWLGAPIARVNERVRRQAARRQSILTKPPGALGRLEALAIRLAALQGTAHPRADAVHIAVFAGDHGVVVEGVSAFPQSVTIEMVRNFAHGGAAISVLARELGATLEVINLGTVESLGQLDGVVELHLGPGTANITAHPAMTDKQFIRSLGAGRQSAERAVAAGAQLFIGGEMGIGNTTAATATACALLSVPPESVAGPGAGLDRTGVARKVEVIRRALALHRDHLAGPMEALRHLGGFEIAALTGAFITCAQIGLPVLVDGFIAGVAALVAERRRKEADHWFIHAHTSAEPGHAQVLRALNARPLLDLEMRLGEGSGAAMAVPLLRLACALHNGMATFTEAGVSHKN